MKTFVAFSAFLALALAKPSTLLAPVVVAAPVTSSQYHTQDELGQYSYGYSNSLSSKAETKSLDGITKGAYSYVDADGNMQSVEYSSDEASGFKVLKATNLPVAPVVPDAPAQEAPVQVEDTPEVAEAKTKHLEEIEKAKARAADVTVEAPAAVHLETISAVVPYAAPYYHGVVPAIAPIATVRVAAPGLAYSYGVPAQYTAYTSYQAPVITYAAPVPTSHIVKPVSTLEAPLETPEVVQARADHLAEVEKVKARDS